MMDSGDSRILSWKCVWRCPVSWVPALQAHGLVVTHLCTFRTSWSLSGRKGWPQTHHVVEDDLELWTSAVMMGATAHQAGFMLAGRGGGLG